MHASQIIRFLRKHNVHQFLKPLKIFIPYRYRRWAELNTHRELVDPDVLMPEYKKALAALIKSKGADGLGDYLEFGVCHGTSMTCMHRALKDLNLKNVRMFGFDSFEGLPDNAKLEGNKRFPPGAFSSSIEKTKAFLSDNGIDWKNTVLVKGFYSETLTEDLKKKHNITKASIIMVDVDIYSSSKEALNWCKSLITDTAIVFFDDWFTYGYADKNLGEKKALDEFLVENPQFKMVDLGDYALKGITYGKILQLTKTAA
jgi:O-methyltransferase